MSATPGDIGDAGVGPTQASQSPGALTLDQGAKGLAHQGGLLGRTSEALCLCEQVIIQGKSRAHDHLPFLCINIAI
jgi:hypothetical protein